MGGKYIVVEGRRKPNYSEYENLEDFFIMWYLPNTGLVHKDQARIMGYSPSGCSVRKSLTNPGGNLPRFNLRDLWAMMKETGNVVPVIDFIKFWEEKWREEKEKLSQTNGEWEQDLMEIKAEIKSLEGRIQRIIDGRNGKSAKGKGIAD